MKIWLCILSLFCWANLACAQAPQDYPDVPLSNSAYADMSNVNPAALEQCYTGPRAMTRYEFAVAVARTLQQIPAVLAEKPAATPALARLIAQFTPELQQLGFSQTQIELAQKELAPYRMSTLTEYPDVPADDPAYEELDVLYSAGAFHGASSRNRNRQFTRYEFAVAVALIVQGLSTENESRAITGEIKGPQVPQNYVAVFEKSPAACTALVRLIAQFTPEVRQLGISQTQIELAQKELATYRVSTPAPFPDVPKNHWAFDAVERLRQSGIVVGYPAGASSQTFAP